MRLIDADALRFNRKIHRFIQIDRYTGAWPCILLADLCDAYKVPTIDAEPVKHGRWVEAADGRTICNQCGEYPLYDYFGRLKLSTACPNCGARMDLPEQAEEAYRGDQ